MVNRTFTFTKVNGKSYDAFYGFPGKPIMH